MPVLTLGHVYELPEVGQKRGGASERDQETTRGGGITCSTTSPSVLQGGMCMTFFTALVESL